MYSAMTNMDSISGRDILIISLCTFSVPILSESRFCWARTSAFSSSLDNLSSNNFNINLSLSFLEQVIAALNEKKAGRTHIPYRNSMMTTILKDSLGGNCKTILIANVSSCLEYIDETLSTMRFAMRCARVENQVRRNEHMDLNVLVSKLQSENIELKRNRFLLYRGKRCTFVSTISRYESAL